MRKCLNCKNNNRETDTYCRNCGCILHSNGYYVFVNVMIIFLVIGIFLIIMLFIASYFV